MIFLRTGANGSGKTLLTLRDVRALSLKESRAVYYNGRFDMIADFGWHKIDAKDWQQAPDGAIFLFDECHNDFPVRKGDPPEYVKMLAEHRRRGFDFFLITQHPLNIDAFVRRLIGAPGWHQHLKRVSGAPLVSVLEWASVNDVCQKAGSGASGSTVMVPFPKEVFTWYQSTSLDTARVKVPFQVKVLLACLVLVPVVIYFAVTSFKAQQASRFKAASTPSVLAVGRPAGGSGASGGHVLTVPEFLASYQARVEGLPQTAPRYDDLTKPTVAPFPAACIKRGTQCKCFTQQGTKLTTAPALCLQIVAQGWFMDWELSTTAGGAPGALGGAHRVGNTPSQVQGYSGGAPVGLPELPLPVQTAAADVELIRAAHALRRSAVPLLGTATGASK